MGVAADITVDTAADIAVDIVADISVDTTVDIAVDIASDTAENAAAEKSNNVKPRRIHAHCVFCHLLSPLYFVSSMPGAFIVHPTRRAN